MRDKATQLLQEMERQLAHYNEQILMTQAAIQILQLLLAESEDGNNDASNDDADNVAGR